MSKLEIPNFGALLGPALTSVEDAARPGLLARLERGAAERYREWAKQAPDCRAELSGCADREDQIADAVDALFPVDSAQLAKVEAAVPLARKLYYEVFEGLPLLDQWRIQANAERQGAAAWRGIATQQSSDRVRDALEDCARLEEASAGVLDELISVRSSSANS